MAGCGWLRSAFVTIETLAGIRDRVLPMLQLVADQYRDRVAGGYPNVVDEVDRGVIGLEIDPSHALFVMSDGTDVMAELYLRNTRDDNRSSGSRQKFSGVPFNDQRPLGADTSDQELRNLIAELMREFNHQPGLLFITDQ